MPSIMAMECVLEKHYSSPSPARGALLDATKCAQEIFSQILCACHKGMCVISVPNLSYETLSYERFDGIKGYPVCEGGGFIF